MRHGDTATRRHGESGAGERGSGRRGDTATRGERSGRAGERGSGRHGDAETRGHGDAGTGRRGDGETRRCGRRAETPGHGGGGTLRHGETTIRRVAACGQSECYSAVTVSHGFPRPRASAVSVPPCLRVSVSYGFHLMLQPALGLCCGLTGWSESTASIAARRSLPVTGTPLLGRLPSKRPR